MASIDELFKKPNAPAPKRKLDLQDPNEIYKRTKLENDPSSSNSGQATVEDAADEDDEAAGPELPPDFEEGDDEDGRFFGGGISNDTAEVLDFIEEKEKDDTTGNKKIDGAWLRRIALAFEKKISKNAELRSKHDGQPQKFMASEADLDADIKSLSILTEHLELYPEFVRLGCVSSLVSLLAHENTDIAIDVLEVVSELIDQDVEAEEQQWDSLVDAMIEADLLDLVFQNLSRLDEKEDSDRAGVYHALEIYESLLSKESVATRIGKNSSLIKWLLDRATLQESPVSQNKQYAAEVLAILAQTSEQNAQALIDSECVDILLQALSVYRKRDPSKGTDEEEFVENCFDCLVCAVDSPAGKEKFLEAEGTELCLIMLKEGKMCRPRALRLLDHALGGSAGRQNAEKLVEAAGLKHVFSLFMKNPGAQVVEHLLGIMSSMLRLLPGDSDARIRLLGKFVEKDYEKIHRLLTFRRDFSTRVGAVDNEIDQERKQTSASEQSDRESEWLSRRLDAGLFSLQSIDVILAWLVAEDDGAKQVVKTHFADRDESLRVLRKSIEDQMQDLSSDSEADQLVRDMLSTLAAFLE